jgi:hypothetical protein
MKVLLAGIALAFAATNAHALEWRTLEWRVGVAYASGLGDVTDLHEDNLRAEGLEADVDLKIPLGIAAGVTYDWPSGARIDLTVGPTFFIGGDVSYFELPIGLTGGYSFARDADVSPYVRAGLVHHIASGDYEAGSTPGLLVAAGIDFTRLTIEIAADNSEVEFESVECSTPGVCTVGRKELNT